MKQMEFVVPMPFEAAERAAAAIKACPDPIFSIQVSEDGTACGPARYLPIKGGVAIQTTHRGKGLDCLSLIVDDVDVEPAP